MTEQNQANRDLRGPGGRRQRAGLSLIVLLVVSLVCLSLSFLPLSSVVGRSGHLLPVSLHSVQEADYSADEKSRPNPPISGDIVMEVILDNDPDAPDLRERLETVTAVFLLAGAFGHTSPWRDLTAHPFPAGPSCHR